MSKDVNVDLIPITDPEVNSENDTFCASYMRATHLQNLNSLSTSISKYLAEEYGECDTQSFMQTFIVYGESVDNVTSKLLDSVDGLTSENFDKYVMIDTHDDMVIVRLNLYTGS